VPAPRPRRVLVIEDDPDSLELLTLILRTAGHLVKGAPDGGSGIDLARTFLPEVLICDIRLPDVNGFEVARAIASEPALESCYVIAVTGMMLEPRVKSSAVHEYFRKPVDPEQLLAAVERAP
jgi:CheY-like chemotaxis protein